MNLEINKVSLFPTNLFVCTIDEGFCDAIIELVGKEKDSWKKGLRGVKALTTGFDGLRYPLLREISDFACSKILPVIGDSQGWKYNDWETKEAWINFYQEKDYTVPHHHFFNDFCAVLIVKEGLGNLKFVSLMDSTGARKHFEQEIHEKINERKGSFIFFPSRLTHYVSDVKKDRITVAFNFINESIHD
jgi:hypothetical protein